MAMSTCSITTYPQVEAMTLSYGSVHNEPKEFQWGRDDREFQHYEIGSASRTAGWVRSSLRSMCMGSSIARREGGSGTWTV